MKIASIAELKKELKFLSEKELTELVMDLAKFNTQNKAYLFFKIYERDNPRMFIEMVQEDIEIAFMDANSRNYHVAKKALQKIRRKLNTLLKLSKDKAAQIECIIYFCQKVKDYGYLSFNHPVIDNLYAVQLRKIENLIAKLHPDLQYDYQIMLDEVK